MNELYLEMQKELNYSQLSYCKCDNKKAIEFLNQLKTSILFAVNQLENTK